MEEAPATASRWSRDWREGEIEISSDVKLSPTHRSSESGSAQPNAQCERTCAPHTEAYGHANETISIGISRGEVTTSEPLAWSGIKKMRLPFMTSTTSLAAYL